MVSQITTLGSKDNSLQCKALKLDTILRQSIARSGIPSWLTMVGNTCSFTLKSDDKNHYYNITLPQINHSDLFKTATKDIECINSLPKDKNLVQKYIRFTEESLIQHIYGNNMQEQAGHEVFPFINRDTTEYENYVQFLKENFNRFSKAVPTFEDVVKSRREVIQHTKALLFFLNKTLNNNNPLTESLFKQTHSILCSNISTEDGIQNYQGLYRSLNVRAGSTIFPDFHSILSAMATLILDFNADIESREREGGMDPWFLAADICQDFVFIHPFQDGNGRMCRLIANAFLIKYTGLSVCVGETEADRKEYMRIVEVGADGETEEKARGMLGAFFLGKGVRVLTELRGVLEGVI